MWRFAGALVAAILGLSGCGSDPIRYFGTYDCKAITATTGREIEVHLGTMGPGCYGDPSVSTDAVGFLGTMDPETHIPSGPTQIYRFKTLHDGESRITIPFLAPQGSYQEPFDFELLVIVGRTEAAGGGCPPIDGSR